MSLRRSKDINDVIDEIRREQLRQKAGTQRKEAKEINYIRNIPKDTIALTDSVAMGAKATIPTDTIGLTDSNTATKCARFEIETLDTLHADECILKIEFFELFT